MSKLQFLVNWFGFSNMNKKQEFLDKNQVKYFPKFSKIYRKQNIKNKNMEKRIKIPYCGQNKFINPEQFVFCIVGDCSCNTQTNDEFQKAFHDMFPLSTGEQVSFTHDFKNFKTTTKDFKVKLI